MRQLDFIIIGAAKAGTTSLHALLTRHPGIFMPDPKEPEYFARDDLFLRGPAEYAGLFEPASESQLIGEASTIYSLSPLFPDTAARIHAHSPDARLVYMLRQPVDRAYSYYVQLTKNYQNRSKDYTIRRRFEDFILPERHAAAAGRAGCMADFDAHLPDTPELCLAGSDYVLQIEAYLSRFERSQMLFLKFEDFKRNPQAVVRQITDFLGVPPLDESVFRDPATRKNISSSHFAEVATTESIGALKQRLGRFWNLRKLLPESRRTQLRRYMRRRADPERYAPVPMEASTRALLEQRFAAQIPRLSELTGLDFGEWGLGAPDSARPVAAGSSQSG
ncbi:sulfotransferase domain-containing protein [Seohaeicola zhoushanensis]|uniref:Sulfotransferase n=1 Tax=Seohaeicola zhoushanensis TaxID=1569283 RepID=A0A8J3H3S2_9RHOB|nr:sulfotransferase domain-containing protein [Seohaeicola zhoushanensis]GHF74924.1 sulfotransferase [Seohaeicola zhoushanensis]